MNAATIVGMARKNENSAAARRSRPSAKPPKIVAPERDTPGISAKRLKRADANGAPDRRFGGVLHFDFRRPFLDRQHREAAEDERPSR